MVYHYSSHLTAFITTWLLLLLEEPEVSKTDWHLHAFALWIHSPEFSCNILCNIEYNHNDANISCTWPNLRCSVNWVSHHDNKHAQRPLKTTHFWFAPTQSSLPTNPAHRIWLPTTCSSSPKLSERAAAQRRKSSMYHRWQCRIRLMFFKRDKRSGNQGDGWSTFLLSVGAVQSLNFSITPHIQPLLPLNYSNCLSIISGTSTICKLRCLVGLSEAVYKNTSVSFQEKRYILPDSAMIQFPTALPGKSYFFHILSVPTCGVYRWLNVCVIWGFF